MEDSFDLIAIAKVAYKIFETCFDMWPDYEGILNFMTDRSTYAKVRLQPEFEKEMLYKISSRSYLRNPRSNDKTPKSLEDFESTIKYRFTDVAQERQNCLNQYQQELLRTNFLGEPIEKFLYEQKNIPQSNTLGEPEHSLVETGLSH